MRVIGLDDYAKYLISNYGRNSDVILDHLKKMNEPPSDFSLAKAELWYCIHHEMVISPLDFFVRRTGMLFFYMNRLMKLKQPILDEFKKYFEWSNEKVNAELEKLNQAIKEAALS
jgi:glycerol-3-phosphate dehydrogenase